MTEKGRSIYRGFIIVKHGETKYKILDENDEEIGETATFDGAQSFVDAHKRRGGK